MAETELKKEKQMSTFKVLFSATNTFPEVSLKLEADSWFQAFEASMINLGKQDMMKSIFCDVRSDGSVFVSYADAEGSVTITEDAPLDTFEKAMEEPVATPKPDPLPEPVSPPPTISTLVDDENVTIVSPPAEAPIPAPEEKGEEIFVSIIEPAQKDEQEPHLSASDLFEEVMDIFDLDESKALEFVMDVAMKYIPSESGSIALAQLADGTLKFSVTRGPKAAEVKGMVIHVGQGLIGFSAKNSSCIAVNDVSFDPRFFKKVGDAVSYKTESLLCAPIVHPETEIVFGVLELINKNGGKFTETDLNHLKFIADKAGDFLGLSWDSQNNSFDD